MSARINDYSSQVHDNEIQSYHADFKNRILTMETVWQDKEATTIEFSGLLSYRFESVAWHNVILTLCEISVDQFVEEEEESLSTSVKRASPLFARDCGELRDALKLKEYRVYQMDSSIGLCGYVIAKNIRISIKEKAQ